MCVCFMCALLSLSVVCVLCEVFYCNLPKNKTYANINAHVASFRENACANHIRNISTAFVCRVSLEA